MEEKEFKKLFLECIKNKDNPFHPLVWINGEPEFGENVYIGGFSEVNANGSSVKIGDNCDIASFVAINVSDSHKLCIELSDKNEKEQIVIENNVFIGSHTFIGKGTHIGHHSVIAAGIVLNNITIPPYSLVTRNPFKIRKGYYKDRVEEYNKIKKIQ